MRSAANQSRSYLNHLVYSVSVKYFRKWEHNEAVHETFIDFKKAYESVRREDLYNILIGFGIPKKLVRLIKMCLTETYSSIRVAAVTRWRRP
jgi:hypothetical protein